MPADDEMQWLLGVQRPTDDGSAGVAIEGGVEISLDDYRAAAAANGLIRDVTISSPFAALERRVEALFETLEEARGSGMRDVERVETALTGVLWALRAFDDKTRGQLSSAYGNPSPELSAFERATNRAFDGSFSYRFCYKLRNYAQHVGSALGHVNSELVTDDDGSSRSTFEVWFDSQQLLDSYDQWGVDVRQDLQEIRGRFAMRTVIDEMFVDCQDIYRAMMFLRAAEISEAVDVVRDFADRAPSEDGRPILIGLPAGAGDGPPTSLQMEVLELRTDVADLCERIIASARRARVVQVLPPDELSP